MKKFLVFLLLVGCTSSESTHREINSHSIVEIKVDVDTSNFFPWKDVVDHITPIQLETNADCLISYVSKLIVMNDRIYIFDKRQQELFIFHNNGRFEKKLNKQGGGPGEYREMRDIQIDANGNIWVLDYNSIKEYSQNFDLKDEIRFSFTDKRDLYVNAMQFVVFENSYVLWTGGAEIMKNSDYRQHNMYRINKKGQIIDSYFPVNIKTVGNPVFFKFGDTYIMRPWDFRDRTVYELTADSVRTKYRVEYLSGNMPENFIKPSLLDAFEFNRVLSETSYAIGIEDVIEGDEFVYFTFFQGDRIRSVLYDKITGSSRVGKVHLSNFAPPYVQYASDDNFYGTIEAGEYVSLELGENTIPKIENVNSDDNPIVFLYGFKRF